MARFISVDWGTSVLRLWLVQSDPFQILSEWRSADGIASVWTRFRDADIDREAFFQQTLSNALAQLPIADGMSLSNMPLLISGMASSSIGMRELRYAKLPFSLEEPDWSPCHLPPSGELPYPVSLFTGLQFEDKDVMRGEETTVIGWHLTTNKKANTLVILPGTHCKHVMVEDRSITHFRTFMTGDVFKALSTHTILKASVGEIDLDHWGQSSAFLDGVADAQSQPLLSAVFDVRAASLFDRRSPSTNADYLSGLLLGAELAAIPRDVANIVVISDRLAHGYTAAIEHLGFGSGLMKVVGKDLVPRAHAHLLTGI